MTRTHSFLDGNAQLRSAIRVIFQIETAGREPVYTEVL